MPYALSWKGLELCGASGLNEKFRCLGLQCWGSVSCTSAQWHVLLLENFMLFAGFFLEAANRPSRQSLEPVGRGWGWLVWPARPPLRPAPAAPSGVSASEAGWALLGPRGCDSSPGLAAWHSRALYATRWAPSRRLGAEICPSQDPQQFHWAVQGSLMLRSRQRGGRRSQEALWSQK